MEEAQDSRSFKLKRSIVIVVASLLLMAVMVMTAYKITKSFRRASSIDLVDTSAVAPLAPIHQKESLAIKPGTDSMVSAKGGVLYTKYFEKDTLPQKYPQFLLEAFSGYDLNDYIYLKKLDLVNIDASLSAKEMADKHQILSLGHYYKGIGFLMVNDEAEAIANLRWCISHPMNEHQLVKARWYLALAYLKINDPAKAIPLLETVENSRPTFYYAPKAKKLLEELHQ